MNPNGKVNGILKPFFLVLVFVFSGCHKEGDQGAQPGERNSGVDVSREWLDELSSLSQEKGAYAQVCAACHGAQGRGNEELRAPSIAGLPAWYIKEQFAKFREGKRGAHQEDIPGQQMRAIALSLTESQIEEAARAVAQLPIVLTEKPSEEANIDRGRYLFANQCMECHRYNGKGEVVFHSAQLISLNRSYLRRQLNNFHTRKRGANENDIYGNKMVDVTSRLSDEDIEVLVDYIGALAHGDDPRPARER